MTSVFLKNKRFVIEWTVCTLECFKLRGEEERQLMICRVRSGCEPVLVKINTTVGEEQVKEKEVFLPFYAVQKEYNLHSDGILLQFFSFSCQLRLLFSKALQD